MAATNLLSVEAVTVHAGTTTLLDAVSLGVAAGDRIGVVGRNGSGKSTLLRVLAGGLAPDSGRVAAAGGMRLGRLPQADELPPDATVAEVVLGGRAEHEWASAPRVRALLAGLGLEAALDRPVAPMSGGERRRVALAALLAQEVLDGLDLLLLDEPTNHLDVEGVDWLARWLVACPCALVVVTHDRWFLDAVTTATWEVVGGRVEAYEGGYAAYTLARAERARRAAGTEARRQNLLRKELAWLRRGPPARTSKPRFRIEAAQALIADEPAPRDSLALRRFAGARLGKDVVDIESVTVSRGGRVLLDEATWRLGPGDRVGLIGANGAGKTTVLRLLAGELEPDTGTVRRGQTVVAATLQQEIDDRALAPGSRVIDVVEEVARSVSLPGGKERSASGLLEDVGFPPARQNTPVDRLSGGERRRLALLRRLLAGPNLLLLDEPTNDLDVDTLTAVEDLLDSWPGTLVVVSHDRYFLERVCDTVQALPGDGRLVMLPGGVEEYLQLRAAATAAPGRRGAGGGAEPPLPQAGPASGDSPPARPAAQVRGARKELLRLERRMEKLATQRGVLEARLADVATDYARVRELDAQLRELAVEQTEAETAWLAVAEDLEG